MVTAVVPACMATDGRRRCDAMQSHGVMQSQDVEICDEINEGGVQKGISKKVRAKYEWGQDGIE